MKDRVAEKQHDRNIIEMRRLSVTRLT